MVAESNLAIIDSYLANTAKVLDSYQPHWVYQPGYRDHQIGWPILEEDSGKTRSKLQFRIPEMHPEYCSISLVFRGSIVCRVDKDAVDVCKANPPFAANLGLPHQVCGPHVHGWHDNREYIAKSGIWDVPARRPVEEKIDGIDSMFFWFCNHINVRIQPHNRPLILPDAGLWSRTC